MAAPPTNCPECGQPVRSDWLTCAVCGSRLTEARRPRRTFRPDHGVAYAPARPANPYPEEEGEEMRPAPRPRSRPRRRGERGWIWWGLFPVLIILAILFVALYGIDLLPARAPPSSDLVPAGSQYTVPPVSLTYVEFTLSETEQVSVAFSATAGVYAYVLNQSQLNAITGGEVPTSFAWGTGNVTSDAFSLSLQQDVWFLTWENFNTGPVTVTFTSALTATA